MMQGKEKKKTSTHEKLENEKTCGKVELPQLVNDEKENRDLVSCSTSFQANSEDVDQNRIDLQGYPDSDEQPDSEDIYDVATLFSLIVQRYEGETCEGRFHGEGVACFEGGHIYKGIFTKGLMDGCGVFTRADGLKYEGDFVCNMPMGQGTYTWPDGSSYKGEVYNGVRHGTGSYKCAKNGVSYKGQWVRGKRHGKGTVYYNQDKTSWYKGDWVKNNREGWGVRCYPSGNIYSGEWKNNLRNGEGTMTWLKLGQKYVGMWQNGIQHGRGIHVWNLRQADGSQYPRSNQYTGDFVKGQMHGQGTFYYSGGATYEGEWSHNKRHAKRKFTFNNGHVFEEELMDDPLMTNNLNGTIAPSPLCGAFPPSGSNSSFLRADMALNIEYLLDLIPERVHDSEHKQVEYMVLMQGTELRSICSFYSRLGRAHSPDNDLLLTRLQLWRLLKDCNIHHHNITLTQIDRFIKEDATTAEIHSPFHPIPLRRFFGYLVGVAYLIYHTDMVPQKHLLAACFSRLMNDDVLPHAKNVKGFLFRQPDCSVVAVNYLKKCWEIYQAYCKVSAAPRDDQTMTYRQLLWMFKDLRLLDNNLTTAALLKIINAENCDLSNLSSCLDLEITFLEFSEVLMGSAEVKCQQVFGGLAKSQSLFSSEAEDRRDLPEVEADTPENSPITPENLSSSSVETEKSNDAAELSTAQDVERQQDVRTVTNEKPQSAKHKEDRRRERKGVQTRGIEAQDSEVKLLIQAIHQFFSHFLFPAFEHNQLVSRNMKEEKLYQEAQRHGSGQGQPRQQVE